MQFPKKCKPWATCGEPTARYALDVVRFERECSAVDGAPALIASSKSALVVVKVDASDDDDAAGFVTVEAMQAAKKAAVRQSHATLAVNGGLRVLNGPTYPRPDLGEREFPRYEAVIPPAREGAHTFNLNVRLLCQIADAFGCEVLTFQMPEAGQYAWRVTPSRCRGGDSAEAEGVGVVMGVEIKRPA